MTITYELNLNSFEAWSGAVNTLDRIKCEGKCEELEETLEELYPDGMTETELNDLLWFEADEVYSWLGLRTESEIQGEIDEAEEELSDLDEEVADLQTEYNDECIGIADRERKELWNEDYKELYDDLQEKIIDVKEHIDELKEELKEL